MKLVLDFRDLLKNKVNLDDTRLKLLDSRVDSVFTVLNLRLSPGLTTGRV